MTEYFTNDFSKEIWETKYQDGQDVTIEGTWLRSATALASVEKDKKKRIKEFYFILEGFAFTPGGRITANAGIKRAGTTMVNCFVSGFTGTDQDSIEGIYSELMRQAQILKSEGGYGFCCNFMRPRGASIKGIGSQSPGAVKFLELWDKSSEIITSGSGKDTKKGEKKAIRKGAQMVTMSCLSPDIVEFIEAKKTPGRLTKFNMSVLCTDAFMLAVEKDKPWNLIYPDYEAVPDTYKKCWDGNFKKWIDGGNPIKVYKIFDSARELWALIMDNTYNRNEPGVLFEDTINKMNNLYWLEYIDASNPCLASWSKILTKDGVKTIADIDVGDEIFGDGDWTKIKRKWSTGINDIYRYQFGWSEDKIIGIFEGTENHHIFSHGVRKPIKDAELGCDCLLFGIPHAYVEEENKTYEWYINAGIPLFKKEFVCTEETFDIEVDNDSHSFWTNGCKVSNCSEQVMPINASCLLGNLNLTQFINEEHNYWDYHKLEKYIPIAVRFMDNVNDVTNYPLPEQKVEAQRKRRIGLGVTGYGSALMMMKIKYGSKKALAMTAELMVFKANAEYQASALLAKEKGAFPAFDKEKYLKSKFVEQLNDETQSLIAKHGMRNSHLSSLQPNGNSSVYSNLISGGLEPLFNLGYYRTVIVHHFPERLSRPTVFWDTKTYSTKPALANQWNWTKEGDEDILIAELDNITYKFDRNRGLTKEVLVEDYAVTWLKKNNLWTEKDAAWKTCTADLKTSDHLNTMKIFAKWVDASISKTVNYPNNYPYKDFQQVYMDAWKAGIKGFTTYRAGTMTNVLSTESTRKVIEKRPKELECDVHHLSVQGKPYFVLVGKKDGEPHEVFAGLNGDMNSKTTKGKIIRVRKNRYKAILDDGEELCPVNLLNDDSEDALTRLTSTALQAGCDIQTLVQRLERTSGTMTTFAKAVARSLKKYIPDGSKEEGSCPECESTNLRRESGCIICSSCGFSACS